MGSRIKAYKIAQQKTYESNKTSSKIAFQAGTHKISHSQLRMTKSVLFWSPKVEQTKLFFL